MKRLEYNALFITLTTLALIFLLGCNNNNNDPFPKAPTLTTFSGSINENVSVGSTLGSLRVYDGGSGITSITLHGIGRRDFSIDTNGTITVSEALDYEEQSRYDLSVTAANAMGNSSAVDVNITINDAEDIAPTLSPFTGGVDEGVAIGTEIGRAGLNGGGGFIKSITLSGEGSDDFSISNNGTISTNGFIDYETKSLYELSALASNDAGTSNVADVRISVNSVQVTGTKLYPFNGSIGDDADIGDVVGRMKITGDGYNLLDLTLEGHGSSDFKIRTNGIITVNNALDHYSQKLYNLTARSYDLDGTTDKTMVDIIVYPPPFTTVWKTNQISDGSLGPNAIAIPTTDDNYEYMIKWGDGTIDRNVTGSIKHLYDMEDTYTVKIYGDFPRIYFKDNRQVKNKIMKITQWGDIKWASMGYAFHGCSSLQIDTSSVPDLSRVTDMTYMFAQATSFTGKNSYINNWDTSSVMNMLGVFFLATAFNEDIGNWDTSNITNMMGVFYLATAFNKDIGNWDTSSVIHMGQMFRGARAFNQDIGNWDTSSAYAMDVMFGDAEAFYQDLSRWNVSGVRYRAGFCTGAPICNNPDYLPKWTP